MDTALAQLRDSLDRVRDIADYIDLHLAEALKDHSVLRRHQTMQCSCTVILCGFLESFVRDLAEAFIAKVSASGKPFTMLHNRIQNAHFEEGGRILQKAAQARRSKGVTWITATTDDIARRLHSVSSLSGYEILWEAFANTQSNPNDSVIGGFLRRFGLEDGWSKLASSTTFSKEALRGALNNLIQIRNECAHTGTAAVMPGPSDLRSFCDLLDTLGTAMVAVLKVHPI